MKRGPKMKEMNPKPVLSSEENTRRKTIFIGQLLQEMGDICSEIIDNPSIFGIEKPNAPLAKRVKSLLVEFKKINSDNTPIEQKEDAIRCLMLAAKDVLGIKQSFFSDDLLENFKFLMDKWPDFFSPANMEKAQRNCPGLQETLKFELLNSYTSAGISDMPIFDEDQFTWQKQFDKHAKKYKKNDIREIRHGQPIEQKSQNDKSTNLPLNGNLAPEVIKENNIKTEEVIHKDSLPKTEEDKIPDKFICPISMELMKDPVITEQEQIYDRTSISEWFKKNDTDPLTGMKLKHKNLTAVRFLKNEIEEYTSKKNKNNTVSSAIVGTESNAPQQNPQQNDAITKNNNIENKTVAGIAPNTNLSTSNRRQLPKAPVQNTSANVNSNTNTTTAKEINQNPLRQNRLAPISVQNTNTKINNGVNQSAPEKSPAPLAPNATSPDNKATESNYSTKKLKSLIVRVFLISSSSTIVDEALTMAGSSISIKFNLPNAKIGTIKQKFSELLGKEAIKNETYNSITVTFASIELGKVIEGLENNLKEIEPEVKAERKPELKDTNLTPDKKPTPIVGPGATKEDPGLRLADKPIITNVPRTPVTNTTSTTSLTNVTTSVNLNNVNKDKKIDLKEDKKIVTETKAVEIPEKYICPLTKKIMLTPAFIAGSTPKIYYDKYAIDAHSIKEQQNKLGNDWGFVDQEELNNVKPDKNITVDLALKKEIAQFLAKNPQHRPVLTMEIFEKEFRGIFPSLNADDYQHTEVVEKVVFELAVFIDPKAASEISNNPNAVRKNSPKFIIDEHSQFTIREGFLIVAYGALSGKENFEKLAAILNHYPDINARCVSSAAMGDYYYALSLNAHVFLEKIALIQKPVRTDKSDAALSDLSKYNQRSNVPCKNENISLAELEKIEKNSHNYKHFKDKAERRGRIEDAISKWKYSRIVIPEIVVSLFCTQTGSFALLPKDVLRIIAYFMVNTPMPEIMPGSKIEIESPAETTLRWKYSKIVMGEIVMQLFGDKKGSFSFLPIELRYMIACLMVNSPVPITKRAFNPCSMKQITFFSTGKVESQKISSEKIEDLQKLLQEKFSCRVHVYDNDGLIKIHFRSLSHKAVNELEEEFSSCMKEGEFLIEKNADMFGNPSVSIEFPSISIHKLIEGLKLSEGVNLSQYVNNTLAKC